MIDVLNSLQKKVLFDKFVNQLHKDFELAGFAKHTPNFNSNNLQHIIDELVISILKIDAALLNIQTLLYRIDVSEKQINQLLTNNTDNNNYYQKIAQLIIKRTVQKIILKQQHSS